MPCGDYINCDNSELSTGDLIRLLIQVDSEGCPALKVVNTSTDIVLYQTSFSNEGALPDGWDVTDNVDWIVDNDNTYFENSSGYIGASGGYKVVNTDMLNGVSPTYLYQTAGVSTIGKENIRLIFGTISNVLGAIPQYSADGGAWTDLTGGEITYTEWTQYTTTTLAEIENKANVKFRFKYEMQGLGQYVAIDDVKILGDLII